MSAVGFGAAPAVTDAKDADADFRYQGEYLGRVYDRCGLPEWVGLHVVALGEGRFDGVVYQGGLPGNGWNRQTPKKVSGAKPAEGAPVLESGELRVEFEKGATRLRTAAGQELGRLPHIRRISQTMGAKCPAGGTVLFDGSDTGLLASPKITPGGLLEVGTETVRPYGDFQMHLEFQTPYQPQGRGQGRGNSGVYLQGRYEVQILDSFGLEGKENECGSLYHKQKPEQNLCFPPLTWQTYDIDFTAARFNACGQKISPTRITVRHNGVVVQNNYALPDKTGAGAPEGPEPRPIKLQNHGDPVRFRNIWIVETTPAPPAPHWLAETPRRSHLWPGADSCDACVLGLRP